MKKIIPSNIKNIISRLKMLGYEAYIVGGSCRDILFDRHHVFEHKKEIKDFDIVTSATPEKVQDIFGDCTTTCGNNFLVTLVNDVEVATFRKDKAEEAEVAFTLEEDVARRDFTINAIAYDLTKEVMIDYTGGISDLDNRILRFIGEPIRRIKEDPVRMLRGIRFASQYSLEIEKETFFAMFQHRHLLNTLPAERIQQEVVKAFKHSNTYRFLTLLEEFEMLDLVFPNLCRLRHKEGGKYHNETVLNHCFNAVKAIDEGKNWKLKLACLYHDMGKYEHSYNDNNEITFKGHNCKGQDLIKYDLGSYLKFSNDVVDYVTYMAKFHMDCIETRKSVRKLMVKLTDKNIPIKDFVLLRYADNKGNVKEYTDFRDTWKSYKFCLKINNEKPPVGVSSLDITGHDVMKEFNLSPCPEVGKLLKSAHEAVINEDIENKYEFIVPFMRQLLEN